MGVKSICNDKVATSEKQIAVNFVGFGCCVISEKEAAPEAGCSVAGNRFQLNLLAALMETESVSVSVTSYRAVPMFPASSVLFQCQGRRYVIGPYEQSQIWFVNVLILKQITMALFILLRLVVWGVKRRGRHRVMLVYNLYAPFSIPTLLAAWVTRSIAVALVADTPHSQYTFKGVKGLLEKLDFFQQTRVMKHFSGVICLTKQTWIDFATGRPGLVVEGGVNLSEIAEPTHEVDRALADELLGVRVCLYSGALDHLNGIPMLLEGFALVADPSVRLWLLGRGECSGDVMDAAKCDPRIVFWGFRANEEVKNLQRVATVLINPRPSQQEITKYTFPSKLLEYMQSGTPVLTTRLPGIPNEYYKYMFAIDSETAEGVAESLRRVFAIPSSELKAKSESARQFVVREKSWKTQGLRIACFLSHLTKGCNA